MRADGSEEVDVCVRVSVCASAGGVWRGHEVRTGRAAAAACGAVTLVVTRSDSSCCSCCVFVGM